MDDTSKKSKLDFRITLSADRLAVLFEGVVAEDRREELVDAVTGELGTLGVDAIPEKDELWQILAAAPRDEAGRVSEAVLLRGTPAVPSKNGRIEWARDFFSSGFTIDEKTGIMNYRERTGEPSVEVDELLARIHPPEEGQDGRDVLGNRIPAAKPKPVRIRCGMNVKASDDGYEFHATAKGRVRYSKHVLSVDRVYVINGNVGLETGNIDHPGALFIEGDVEAGARIRADGDIEVRGIVEGADIEAGGNLSVRRGITGCAGHRIQAGGRVNVRFLVEAEVVAGDDVVVESEMVNSRVITKGSFIMHGGRLVGGSVTAQGNIYVKQAGSEGVVRTRLVIELDPALAQAIANKEAEMKRIRESLKKIKDTLTALKTRKGSLSDSAREALAKLAGNISDMQATLQTLESEREELLAQMRNRGRPQILIQGIAYPESTFDIYTHRLRLRESITGPVRAVAGRHGIEFQPVTAPVHKPR